MGEAQEINLLRRIHLVSIRTDGQLVHELFQEHTMRNQTMYTFIAFVVTTSLALVIGHHIPAWAGAWYILCSIAPIIID